MTIFIAIPIADPEITELGLLLIVLTPDMSYAPPVIAELMLIAILISLNSYSPRPTFALH